MYDLLGSTALAVAMLLLGIALIVWGFTKWKVVSEKKCLYWILAVGLAVGVALANINFRSSEKIMEDMDADREAQIDAVRNSGGLNFSKPEVDRHFAEFNKLYERFEKSLADKVCRII